MTPELKKKLFTFALIAVPFWFWGRWYQGDLFEVFGERQFWGVTSMTLLWGAFLWGVIRFFEIPKFTFEIKFKDGLFHFWFHHHKKGEPPSP